MYSARLGRSLNDFSQQTAVITGGAQGIGGAVADALRAGGARIAIWDLDADLAAEKAASLGGGCFALPVNVADWSNVEAARDETLSKLGASISWSIVLALQARTRLSKIIRWIISQRLSQSIWWAHSTLTKLLFPR